MSNGDRVAVVGMQFYARHGTADSERELGQRFEVDVEFAADLRPAGVTDQLEHAVDYRRVYAVAAAAMEPPCRLLEAVAERIASGVLALPGISAVTVRVRKPSVPLGGVVAYAQVQITRVRA